MVDNIIRQNIINNSSYVLNDKRLINISGLICKGKLNKNALKFDYHPGIINQFLYVLTKNIRQ